MTVEPARVGLNTVHLYLIDAKTGTQFTQTKELTVTATAPSEGDRPAPAAREPRGPGPLHPELRAAHARAAHGSSQLTDRVSEFQEYSKTIKVPIR